jgi:hypothetical protein
VRTAVSDSQHAPESERVAEAEARALERLHRQRQSLRPLGWAVILVVVLTSANSHPVPSLHGKGLGVTVALAVFAAMLLIAIRDGFPERPLELQAAVIAAIGAGGVAIGGLQQTGATGVAASVAVFMAIARLPLRLGAVLGGLLTVGLGVATAIAGSSSSAVAAEVLVTVLLGIVAEFLKQSRQSQDHPSCCSLSSPTRAMSRRKPRRSPSVAGSRASCTTCSRTPCRAPRSSFRVRASSPTARTPVPC